MHSGIWDLIMGSFRDGLCLAKDMLIGNLIAEMDCQIAVNLLNANAMCVRSSLCTGKQIEVRTR